MSAAPGQQPRMSQAPGTKPQDSIDYSSVDNMEKAQKIDFLKRTDFDPHRLKNPYDYLNAQMYRASLIMKNMDAGKYTPEQRTKVLNGIYDRMIMPFYEGTKGESIKGTDAPSREQWLRNADSLVKNFDMDRSYRGSWYSGMTHGVAGMLQDGLNAGKTVVDLFGASMSPKFWHTFRNELLSSPQEITDESWQKQVEYDKGHPAWSFWKGVDENARHFGAVRALGDWINKWSDRADFYQRLRPLPTYRAAAASFVAQAMPFVAVEALTGGGATPAEAGEIRTLASRNLTNWIGSPRAGHLAEGMLHGARDGFIYGALTRPIDNKGEAMNDAMQWAIGNTVLNIGGSSVMYLGKKTVRLGVRGTAAATGDRLGGDLVAKWEAEATARAAEKAESTKFSLEERQRRAAEAKAPKGPKAPPEAPYRVPVSQVPAKPGEVKYPEKPPAPPAPQGAGPARMPASMEEKLRGREVEAPYRVQGIQYPGRAGVTEVPSPQVPSEAAQAERAVQEHANRGKLIDAGRREVTPEEAKDVSEAGVAENIAKHGIQGQNDVTIAATQHILDMEGSGLTPEQIKAKEIEMLEKGSDGDRILLDQVHRIRAAIGNVPLNSLDRDAKVNLWARLQALAHDAAGRMTQHVATLQEAFRQKFLAIPPEKLDADIKRYLIQQLKLPPGASPEQAAAAVQQHWLSLVEKAGKDAEDHLVDNPTERAKEANANRKRAEGSQLPPLQSRMTAKTRKSSGKLGDAVSYSYTPDWVVYAKAALKKTGREWTSEEIKDWVTDLSEEDFANDLQAFFLPKVLTEGGKWFEKDGVANDRDYTNLYAFAYNYKDQMPTQIAKRLEQSYFDAPKLNRFFGETKGNPRLQTGMGRRISLSLWNHVDSLLVSGRFNKESNVFRSTATDWHEPTKWMNELFEEREQAEQAIVDKMFRSKSPEAQAARNTLAVLFYERRVARGAGEHLKERLISERIKSAFKEPPKGAADLRAKYKDPWKSPEDLQAVVHTETDPRGVEVKRIQKEIEEHKQVYDELISEAGTRERDALKRRTEAPWDSEEWHKAEADRVQARKDWKQAFDERFKRVYTDEEKEVMYGKDAGRTARAGSVTQRPDGKTMIWFNREMINRFQRLKSPLSIGTLYGQNVGHPDIQRILDHLDRKGFPNLTAQDQRMYRLLAKAKSIAGPEGVNVAVLEGKTFKELLGLKEVHKEEFTHGWQRQLLGKDIPDWKLVDEHLDQSVAEDLHAKIPKGMKDYLSLHYSGTSMKLQVIEAGAKLISQHPEKFNMTIDQAADFLLAYTSAVADKYGNDAFKNLTTAVGVAREIKNIYVTLGKEASVTIERVGSRSAPSP